MTVSTQINRVDYIGNGSTTVFAVPFPFFTGSDLDVYVDGVLQTLTTHYTVSITFDLDGGFGSASVNFLSAPLNTKAVAIVRDLPVTQTVSTTNNSQLLPSVVEKALDRLTLFSQDVLGRASRAVQLDPSFSAGVTITPASGSYLAWLGNNLVNKTPTQMAADAGSGVATQVVTNTANIATNTADITALDGRLDVLEPLKNPTLAGNALKYARVNAGATAYEAVDFDLPNGYLYAPVPTYDSAQPKKVNFNGALTARSRDNTTNIALSSASRNLDLATNGANGLADGLTVANNTWYYVYAYSGGYVASTTNNATTLPIASVTQKVVQLPLTLRTDGSANILPFYMESWEGLSSHTRYSTQLNGATAGLTGSPTVIGLVSSGTYSAFSLASFVPPPSRVATLFAYCRGGGGGFLRTTGDTNEYIFDLAGLVFSRELTIRTNSSQSIDARVTVNGFDIAVTGYTINL